MHQYKSRGKVSATIMGVAALDDLLGILLFSLIRAAVSIINQSEDVSINIAIYNAFYEIGLALAIGAAIAAVFNIIAHTLKIKGEGQWIIVISALLVLAVGISKLFSVDLLLTSMTAGIIVGNKCVSHATIFRLIERYTEDLIFLFFFILSGLYLDIHSLGFASIGIIIYIGLRAAGKYIGADIGARVAHSDKLIRKYTAGGLLPQAGIVIGLLLSVYKHEEFKEVSELLLTIIMGATIIHEIIGPFIAKHSLKKAGEISDDDK